VLIKNDKLYNILKYVALIFLDALGVAYESLANVWSLPFGDEVMKTCTILSILLGSLIGVSSYSYNKSNLLTDDESDDELLLAREDDING
jgi:hypothetical protein